MSERQPASTRRSVSAADDILTVRCGVERWKVSLRRVDRGLEKCLYVAKRVMKDALSGGEGLAKQFFNDNGA
jgi:hypothetical protein